MLASTQLKTLTMFRISKCQIISEVTERISIKHGHIFINHLWPLFEKFDPKSPGRLPPRAGGKKRFLETTLNLTKNISATEHDINNWIETSPSTGTLLHAPKFGELWFTNGWERLASFCPPLNYSITWYQPWGGDAMRQGR